MALIKCSECGKEISNKVETCIHCGCPIDNSFKDELVSSSDDYKKEIRVNKNSNKSNIGSKIMLVIVAIVFIGFMLFLINTNDIEDNNQEEDQTVNTQEQIQAAKEKNYVKAQGFYNNREYHYAYEYFNNSKGYNDTDDILNSEKYFKLIGNKYQGFDDRTLVMITFDFTSSSGLRISYFNQFGNVSYYGALKMVDNRVYLEDETKTNRYSETHQYYATDYYITNINDSSITINYNGKTYTLDKQ